MKQLSLILTAMIGLFFTQTVVAQYDNELPAIKTDTAIAMFSKEQIEEKLENLSSNLPPPTHWSWSPFYCVSVFGIASFSYICPICGTETKYGHDRAWLGNLGKEEYARNDFGYFEPNYFSPYDDDAVQIVVWRMNQCKHKIKNTKGIHISLDESEFCKYCSPFIKEPKLCLLVNIDGASDTVKTRDISYYDIELLQKFLDGNTFYCDELAYHKNRLKELLGIK